MRIGHELIRSKSTGQRHEYLLLIEVENTGSVKVNDYRIDILFPIAFLEGNYGFEIHDRQTRTHKLFRLPLSELYPDDKFFHNKITYSVDHQRFDSDSLMGLLVEVTVYADGMAAQRVSKPIKELQNF